MTLARLLKDPAYRHWVLVWLQNRRRHRYRPGKLKAFGYHLDVTDHISVVHQFLDIFVNHEYRMTPARPNPVIVDVGANVGVSVLYHCRHLDDPEIHAFEPDPAVFSKLKSNIEHHANGKRIYLMNQAASTRAGPIRFASDGADGGHVIRREADAGPYVEVAGIDLLDYLERFERIDLLKIDIEGGETEVVPHCARALHRVDRIFVEYHSSPELTQSLPRLLAVLQDAGFRLHVQSAATRISPFMPQANEAFDNQLNIFGYRARP